MLHSFARGGVFITHLHSMATFEVNAYTSTNVQTVVRSGFVTLRTWRYCHYYNVHVHVPGAALLSSKELVLEHHLRCTCTCTLQLTPV